MIPILYEKDETAFASNGLGRLRDCISAVVTEERNGLYELEFQYPVSGANYEQIQLGRIVGVTHDDTDDVQPFDIISYSKPINGVVTFHAVHISYRQSYMTATGTNINSLTDAFTLFESAEPSNPFSYWTDKTGAGATGYMAAADGVPKSVRQMLGGTEGSVLDAYGGEYEWDLWTVRLWTARGQLRDFTIRYGVNMLDYNDETDAAGTYSACIPYWTDGTETVVGSRQESGGSTLTGRGETVPLDVSEKFEDKPTVADVEAAGVAMMNERSPFIPAQNITVSFVRLQDLGEFATYQNLLRCGLCDTIRVIFPDLNGSGTFKIVKTTWNVLADRYDEMELGDLSLSLSEALGVTDFQNTSKTTIEQIIERVDDLEEVKTGTPSITRTSGGTVYTSQYQKIGRVVTIRVGFQSTTTVNGGSDMFEGTLNNIELRPLATTVFGCGYYSNHSLIMRITSGGGIIVRNAGDNSLAAVTGTNSVVISLTYIAAS